MSITPFFIFQSAAALSELAPISAMLTVAGFHRARPSTSLNKRKYVVLCDVHVFTNVEYHATRDMSTL